MDAVDLLKTYFQNQQLSFEGNVEEEIQKMNTQSLSGYLYYVYGKPFYKVYLGLTLIQEKYFRLQKEITELLNKNNIDHLYVKGSVLAYLYPDSALRSRGDIDVIVRKDDFIKANQLFQENGFVDLEIDCYHHAEYKKNNLYVELHQDLTERNEIFHDYFDDIFRFATKSEENLYELDKNIHFIYSIYHLNRHLILGEGLRYLLDFYYMQTKWDLNYEFIVSELKKLELYNLFTNINHAIYIITGQAMKYMGDRGQKLIDFMNEKGIHSQIGLKNNADKNQIVQQYTLSNQSKIGYFISRWLLKDKEERALFYPRLSRHKFLYPILLVHRFLVLLFGRFGRFVRVLFLNKKKYNEIKNNYEDIGIIPTNKYK